MKAILELTKAGIVLFVMITGAAGFAVSWPMRESMDWVQLITLIIGLTLVSAGSFAINQAQEWKADKLMKRTEGRPIPQGYLSQRHAYVLGFTFCAIGLLLLLILSPLSALLALLTIIFYNLLYTMVWKKRWAFGAVPGALPGAMPVVIGYSVNNPNIFSSECIYMFLIMFLWQMPHFWCLAIRYKEDYESGGFPVLPNKIGVDRTVYHMGLYVFAYIGVALAAPLFVQAHITYLLLVIPFSIKIIYEFFKFFNQATKEKWLPFFLWVNLSMLVFIIVPVFDKWLIKSAHYILLK